MSTILKALRKIEDESGRNDGAPVWPGPVQIKRQADAKLRNKRKRRQIIFGLGILILVCGAVWIYSLQPVQNRKPIVAAHLPVKDETAPVTAPVRKDSRQGNVFRESRKVRPPKDAEPKIQKNQGYDETFNQTVKPDLSYAKALPTKDFSENQEKPKIAKAEQGRVPNELHRLDEKRDPRIELQAIAWAPEPENSFAVINNRILHEGQSFDGITITHIGEDDVSFREKGNEWREAFRIK